MARKSEWKYTTHIPYDKDSSFDEWKATQQISTILGARNFKMAENDTGCTIRTKDELSKETVAKLTRLINE
ncbi:uncharacterized protein DNG_05036 [Cephalotrichum gorgonifer]|uniref:Uncharacterized protein n=1 Tax=Cephalotrichum gorgonifer TaxID=2041049 RepID=A0AAE8MZQ2_9PEZI|nr:uncharacterized protein DNG_05036 [Cephalotrichum gorgonifer]